MDFLWIKPLLFHYRRNMWELLELSFRVGDGFCPCMKEYESFLTDIGVPSQRVSLERDIEALPCLGRINSIGLETYVCMQIRFSMQLKSSSKEMW